MASADVDMRIHEDQEPLRPGRREAPPPPRYYQASEMLPAEQGPLHSLLQKQPAMLGSLQVMSGIFSVGVGILFAVTQNINVSLCTMFRVSYFTGGLYIIAGLVSNLLFKNPKLLMVSFTMNCACIIVAIIGAILISVDLARFTSGDRVFYKMEVLQLCVLALEAFLSAVLCFWFFKEKPAKSP
ncbi:B-lymphocyte antigen CD20 isoform X2 [Kryptolebias marmoratus]|uniref:B-lymphocyte antigen CD20 isoform X2 n=1 Tax=Kryptolebias marmoratus TaxID=37003 RepID=UPI0007F92E62|nr:B-lymphocyte antigen CD20 isoform X2 [Kryptolebias marmoratus]